MIPSCRERQTGTFYHTDQLRERQSGCEHTSMHSITYVHISAVPVDASKQSLTFQEQKQSLYHWTINCLSHPVFGKPKFHFSDHPSHPPAKTGPMSTEQSAKNGVRGPGQTFLEHRWRRHSWKFPSFYGRKPLHADEMGNFKGHFLNSINARCSQGMASHLLPIPPPAIILRLWLNKFWPSKYILEEQLC